MEASGTGRTASERRTSGDGSPHEAATGSSPLLASLRDELEERVAEAAQRVRERPLGTLLVAAGLGFLVGRLVRS